MFVEIQNEKGEAFLLNVDHVPAIRPGAKGEAIAMTPQGELVLPLSYDDVRDVLELELADAADAGTA